MDNSPDIDTQIQLEELFNKNQTLPRLRREFQDPIITTYCEEVQIPIDFAVDLLAHMVLHKRATIATLVGILGPKHFTEDRDAIPTTEQLQACADMIAKAAEYDLVDWEELGRTILLRIDVSDDVYEELERYQYPLPMVVTPRHVKTNKDTGYYSPGSGKGSIILRNKYHEDDVCLDHINRVNQVELSINTETAQLISNSWRKLDRRQDGETTADYKRRVQAFEKYDRTAKDVMAHLFMTGNRFFITHRYDARGRCYAQGYHVNPQGNDWNKAVIEFANKEKVSDQSQ